MCQGELRLVYTVIDPVDLESRNVSQREDGALSRLLMSHSLWKLTLDRAMPLLKVGVALNSVRAAATSRTQVQLCGSMVSSVLLYPTVFLALLTHGQSPATPCAPTQVPDQGLWGYLLSWCLPALFQYFLSDSILASQCRMVFTSFFPVLLLCSFSPEHFCWSGLFMPLSVLPFPLKCKLPENRDFISRTNLSVPRAK